MQNQFDCAAETYDSVAWLQRKMGDSIVSDVLGRDLPRDIALIDLGCGTGELLRKLAGHQFTQLTGLDLSKKMLGIASEKSPDASFVHADLQSIPFPDHSFSAVVSNAAIQWCDPDAAAKEIARILKPGGLLSLNIFVAGTLAQWDAAFLENGYESRVHKLFDGSRVAEAFAAFGFEQCEIEQHQETNSFGSIDSMFASIKHLGASNAMARRPMSRKEYIDLRRHFEQRLESDGRLGVDFVWLQIRSGS